MQESFLLHHSLEKERNHMPALEIRRYQPDDWDDVWKLHVLAMQRVGAYKGEGPWDDDLYHIEEVYFSKRGEFLVGLFNHRLVAMGAFKQTAQESAEIKRMRTHPDVQGQGFGKAMLNALEERAKQLGYSRLHLETSIIQHGAQKLYLKHGFREIGRAVIDGFDSILFEKYI
jgi:GNAT superfamily N-acetyltransferase